MTGSVTNARWARALVDVLVEEGVTLAVVAPGSRSGPLALAFAARPDVRVISLIDERGAGFFALGHAKRTGSPVAVVTTSGTAAANLYPAAIEANLSGVPLVLLTADRPHALRGVGANQTIDQVDLFGSHVRAFSELALPTSTEYHLSAAQSEIARVMRVCRGRPPGPVHVNVPFAKPLEPRVGATFSPHPRPRAAPRVQSVHAPTTRELETVAALVNANARGLIVCGPRHARDDFTEAVVALSKATGYPVLADPMSGARLSKAIDDSVLGAYDAFLAAGFDAPPEIIIRFGAFPTSSALESYLERHAGIPHVLVTEGFPVRDPIRAANQVIDADAVPFARALATTVHRSRDAEWSAEFARAEALAWRVADATLESSPFEGMVARELVPRLSDGTTLWVSSSLPVRDLDRFTKPRHATIRVHSNRGASGIDGVVSSALGAACASEGPTVLVIGDIALYHDLNGLIAFGRADVDATIIVVNNDGGGIFELLPVRDHEPAYTELFRTPHGLDFEHAARMFGIPFDRVTDQEGLARALDRGVEDGRRLIELVSHHVTNAKGREAARLALTRALKEEA